jgi:hypothetical protein
MHVYTVQCTRRAPHCCYLQVKHDIARSGPHSTTQCANPSLTFRTNVSACHLFSLYCVTKHHTTTLQEGEWGRDRKGLAVGPKKSQFQEYPEHQHLQRLSAATSVATSAQVSYCLTSYSNSAVTATDAQLLRTARFICSCCSVAVAVAQ